MPALPVAIGLMIGIVLWRLDVAWWVAGIGCLGGILLLLCRVWALSVCLLCVTLGWLCAVWHQPVSAPNAVDGKRMWHVTGRVISIEPSHEHSRVYVRVDSLQARRSVSSSVYPFITELLLTPGEELGPGDEIRFTSRLQPLDWADATIYQQQRSVSATAFPQSEIEVIGHTRTASAFFYQWRERMKEALNRGSLDQRAYGLFQALLLGDRTELTGMMSDTFRAVGVAHILALSGYHVGAVTAMVAVFLLPMGLSYRLRRLRISSAIIIIWLYAAVTGFQIGVVRAALMLSIFTVTRMFNRTSQPINSLAVAAVAILLVSPYSLFTAGFQLSFAAVLGIITLAPWLNPYEQDGKLAFKTAALLAVPVAAMTTTMPFIISHFHSLPTYFLLSNIFMALLTPPLVVAGMAKLALGLLGFSIGWFDSLLNATVGLIEEVLKVIEHLPFASVGSLYLTETQTLILVTATGALILTLMTKRFRNIMIGSGVVLLLCSALPAAGSFSENKAVEVVNHPAGYSHTVLIHQGRKAVVALSNWTPADSSRIAFGLTRDLLGYAEGHHLDTLSLCWSDFKYAGYERRGDSIISETDTILIR